MQSFPYHERIIYIHEPYQLYCTVAMCHVSWKKHTLSNGIRQGIDSNFAAIVKDKFFWKLNIIAIAE